MLAIASSKKSGFATSFELPVGPGEFSATFPVPDCFTGHVYVHGVGGNHQAIFAVGSDGNSEFAGASGFLVRTVEAQMPNVTIEWVSKNKWRIIQLPNLGSPDSLINVSIVGVYEPSTDAGSTAIAAAGTIF